MQSSARLSRLCSALEFPRAQISHALLRSDSVLLRAVANPVRLNTGRFKTLLPASEGSNLNNPGALLHRDRFVWHHAVDENGSDSMKYWQIIAEKVRAYLS